MYCRHCGEEIPDGSVICTKCGKQVENLQTEQPNIIIQNNNVNENVNQNVAGICLGAGIILGKRCNKWTSFFLCLFLGYFGAHKFYEGKTGMGILYIFTFGLLGIGWIVDLIAIFFKPNPYYVIR